MSSSVLNLWANQSLKAAATTHWPTATPEQRVYAAEQVIAEVTGDHHQPNEELLRSISEREANLDGMLRVYWRSI